MVRFTLSAVLGNTTAHVIVVGVIDTRSGSVA